jgi:hypothetical protein
MSRKDLVLRDFQLFGDGELGYLELSKLQESNQPSGESENASFYYE